MKIDLNCAEKEPLIEIVNSRSKSNSSSEKQIYNSSSSTRNSRHHRILFISSIFALLLFVHIIIFSSVKNYNKREVFGWSKNKSRDISDYVFPNENTTIIEPSNLCRSPENIFLLIVVCSSAANFEARQTIRETWGNVSEFNYPMFQKLHGSHNSSYLQANNKHWKQYIEKSSSDNSSSQSNINLATFRVSVVFLLGISPTDMSDEQQYEINYENEVYGDIIQENFLDSYNNLTLKSILMLKWVTNNCADKVKYIMKSDDDTFINVPNLLHVLLGGTVPLYKSTLPYYDKTTIYVTKSKNRLSETKHLLLGYKFCNAKKISNTNSKWYVPNYLYSGDYYPDYLSGTAYLFTFDTALMLYNGSISVPLFHLEDVYLTAFVAEKVKIKRTHHPLFFYQYNTKDKCSMIGMISQHQISPAEMQELYNFVTNLTHIHCAVPQKNFMSMKLNLAQRKRCH
ncbi:hypothetical protein PVAND_006220 [Polypedilum vanderplanki]|uniref:Hexosyltransferase n=1 Tax=Polypedilum vanderplanki TaxID=319348 RepID=A0A9J6C3J1_POLVA|nr:hypothetical protein PVAND_006220 [Polypedilum vanderplanki]